nr:spore coat protein U domain-containing protein [Mesorhizobium sp. M4B.F.Ca.ET.049.02.1.2]
MQRNPFAIARPSPRRNNPGLNDRTGVGTAQNLTVYGRVPPQTTPSPGVYTDTVIVTVTYLGDCECDQVSLTCLIGVKVSSERQPMVARGMVGPRGF